MPKRNLSVFAAPFKPSRLSSPPSPFSPKSPLIDPTLSHETAYVATSHQSRKSIFEDSDSDSDSDSGSSSDVDISDNNCDDFADDANNNKKTIFKDVNGSAKSLTARIRPPRPVPPPPERPMPWTWQCHLCLRRYPLAATRRCLEDGHLFCSGVTETKSSRRGDANSGKRYRRHRACQSEFDYDGWKEWGEWRRGVLEERENEVAMMLKRQKARMKKTGEKREKREASSLSKITTSSSSSYFSLTSHTPAKKHLSRQLTDTSDDKQTMSKKRDCSTQCDYPSECRWKQQLKIDVADKIQNPEIVSVSAPVLLLPTIFEEGNTEKTSTTVTVEPSPPNEDDEDTQDNFWKSLIMSASKRKSVEVHDDSVDLTDLVTEERAGSYEDDDKDSSMSM